MTEELKGQMSIADCFGPDIWSGRTCREHYLRPESETEKITEAKISKPSSRKSSGSSKQMLPMFLYLKTDDGLTQDVSWELERTDSRFPLLTEYTMRSFGESPSEENVSLLSQILEDSPLPKYSLSARACAGILRRAKNRGKELPPELEAALIAQSVSKETELTEQTPQDVTDEAGEWGGHTPLTPSTDLPLSVSKNEQENPEGAKES